MTDALLLSPVAMWFQLALTVTGACVWHLFQFWSGTHGIRGLLFVAVGLFLLFGFGVHLVDAGLWLYDVSPALVAAIPLASAVAMVVVRPGEETGDGRTERPTTAPGIGGTP